MAKRSIKSLAGSVLSTGEVTDGDARRLAAAVLGDDILTPPPTKSKADLERLLAKIDGVESQTERAALIRRQLEEME